MQAPKPDPEMKRIARENVRTGRQYLSWMKDQAKVTNEWAEEDRRRYQQVFQPVEDELVADAQGFDTAARRSAAADQAGADVAQQIDVQQDAQTRRLGAMGVRPDAGRSTQTAQRQSVQEGLAVAGARELAKRDVRKEGYGRKLNAVNAGSGMRVNPGTSMQISNGATSAGFSGKTSALNSGANIMNQDYQNQMQSWQAQQATLGSIASGIGRVAGAALTGGFGAPMILSSKGAKTDKTPIPEGENLEAVNDMPVEAWSYKPGMGDGGRHVGAYAEDFAEATGKGDGRAIGVIDAMGVTMGAVQDLSKKVDRIEKQVAA